MEGDEAIIDYKAAYLAEKAQRLQLEEDLDLLALENVHLREEVERLRTAVGSGDRTVASRRAGRSSSASAAAAAEAAPVVGVTVVSSETALCDGLRRSWPQAAGGKNVLSVGFATVAAEAVVLAAGVDGALSVYSEATGDKLAVYKLSAPVLALDASDDLVACALMDGSHAVVDLSLSPEMPVFTFKDHTKYVTCIRWSPDGKLLATCSYDKSASLYRITRENDSVEFSKITTFQFSTAPESLVFVPHASGADHWTLVLAVRDSVHLLYIDCQTLAEELISVNENDWDNHLSFQTLFLALSPDRSTLALATDNNLIIGLAVGSNKRLFTLAGHSSGEYAKPRLAWDLSGKHLYSNSEGENVVYVYSISLKKIVKTLHGHTGIVKDLKHHPTQTALVTGSFDHSLALWQPSTL